MSVRMNVLRVGPSVAEGTFTVSGKITSLVLPELSAADTCNGKFCNGWASAAIATEKWTGFDGLKRNCGPFIVTPLPAGGFDTFVKREGDVPAFAVTEIWTLASDPGFKDRLVGFI